MSISVSCQFLLTLAILRRNYKYCEASEIFNVGSERLVSVIFRTWVVYMDSKFRLVVFNVFLIISKASLKRSILYPKKLVWGIGDIWRFWMIPNWFQMSMRDPLSHLGSISYHSEPSDVPYSPNQFLGCDFFCRFLQQDGSSGRTVHFDPEGSTQEAHMGVS